MLVVSSSALIFHTILFKTGHGHLRRMRATTSTMLLWCIVFGLALTACGTSPTPIPTATGIAPTSSGQATLGSNDPEGTLATPTASKESNPTATIIQPSPTADPDSWKRAPIIPTISERARSIFEAGLARGNDPNRFSKIGDSETFTSWFMAPFDQTPPNYRLGPYSHLEAVIEHFSGSYSRRSVAARQGFNAASVFAPLWADPVLCLASETPLACEFRLHKPSYVFILLGTNDIYHLDEFEDQMRLILEYSIDQGVLPILGTKADNLEGDGSINRTLYNLALEYDIPLWNFWAAVQDLPQAGLDEDQAHLTFGYNHFDDPTAMLHAWPVRNLTALQVLDIVWHATQQ